jgi:hypothetical protein
LDGTLSASQIADLGPMAQAAGVSSLAPDDYSWLMNGGLSGETPAADLGTQVAAPITDLGTPARVGDVLRAGNLPGLANLGTSLSELSPSAILRGIGNVGKVPGLLGNSGGGGGGLLGVGGGGGTINPQPYGSLAAIIRRYYGGGLLG